MPVKSRKPKRKDPFDVLASVRARIKPEREKLDKREALAEKLVHSVIKSREARKAGRTYERTNVGHMYDGNIRYPTYVQNDRTAARSGARWFNIIRKANLQRTPLLRRVYNTYMRNFEDKYDIHPHDPTPGQKVQVTWWSQKGSSHGMRLSPKDGKIFLKYVNYFENILDRAADRVMTEQEYKELEKTFKDKSKEITSFLKGLKQKYAK